MLDVSEILYDPDLSQAFTVMRSSGSFQIGGWVENTPTTINMNGVITVATERDSQQVPEGDRTTGAMLFYTDQQLFITHNDASLGTSDVIAWQGVNYRLVKVWPQVDYGYWKAYGVRLPGA